MENIENNVNSDKYYIFLFGLFIIFLAVILLILMKRKGVRYRHKTLSLKRNPTRLQINHTILDMFLYSALLGILYYSFVYNIEDNFQRFTTLYFYSFISSFISSFLAMIIVGNSMRIFSIKYLLYTVITSFITTILVYINLMNILFEDLSYWTIFLTLIGVKLINIGISRVLGDFII